MKDTQEETTSLGRVKTKMPRPEALLMATRGLEDVQDGDRG